MMATDGHPKLLFIISNDYGELGNARYILHGQDSLQAHSSLLLPPKLFERNQRVFACSTQVYSTIEDILQAIETQRPEIVFLFSGYLFAWDGSMSTQSVADIVACCKRHGCKIVTSDPYLGLLSEPVPTITDAHDSFKTLFEILKGTTHFFPVPCHHLAPACNIRGLATFNPQLICRPARNGQDAVGGNEGLDAAHDRSPNPSSLTPYLPPQPGGEPPSWLFVLGSNDYQIQTSTYGRDLFISMLAENFRFSLSNSRKPILIAPDECIQAVKRKLDGHSDQIELISFCGYDKFTAMLLSAEAAFYWNMVSNSMFHRVLNGLPNFFFDPGHLGRIGTVYELAVQNYFVGREPMFLNQEQQLSLELLRLVEGVFQRDQARMRDQFQSAPSPLEFISIIQSGA